MRIVLINTVYGTGSVGRITAGLYDMAGEHGFQTFAAYGRGKAPEESRTYKIGNRVDFYRHVWKNFWQDGSGFGSAETTARFLQWLDEVKPELLHLHNLHGFYLQTELLFDYIKQRGIPVVWTLHDCWAYTGHCAFYDKNGCEKWKSGCGECAFHRTAYPYALFAERSRENFMRKKAAFCGVDNLTLVTPSRWLAGQIGQSFLREYPLRVIANGIDLEVFSPDGRKSAEAEGERFEVLGAANVWEERKGLSFFKELAEMLPEQYHITLVGLTRRQKQLFRKEEANGRCRLLSHTDSVQELAGLYRAADVFVNPTLEDNFPTANLEALACGAAVVTFRTGGSPETVTDSCGLVVEKGNGRQLAEAVKRVCAGRRNETGFLPAACRAWAERFSGRDRYGEYLELYLESAAPQTSADIK